MQKKSVYFITLTASLFAMTSSVHAISPMQLWQRSSCSMNDLDFTDGQSKTVTCTWQDKDDAGIQLTIKDSHRRLFSVSASCQLGLANRNDQLNQIEGDKSALVNNLNLYSNPITFHINNKFTDDNLNIHFLLNSGSELAFVKRFFNWNRPRYSTGSTITCTFVPQLNPF